MRMVKKILNLVLVLVIFTATLLIVDINLVLAQGVGIKVSPVKQEDMVDPGQVLKKQIKVTNESNLAKTFYVYLRDFKAEDESGRAKLIAPGSEKGYFLASWIEVTKEGIEFKPNEEKVIDFKINVPEDTGPGGYFGAILFGTEPPKLSIDSEEKGAGMSIAQQTASLILLQVIYLVLMRF